MIMPCRSILIEKSHKSPIEMAFIYSRAWQWLFLPSIYDLSYILLDHWIAAALGLAPTRSVEFRSEHWDQAKLFAKKKVVALGTWSRHTLTGTGYFSKNSTFSPLKVGKVSVHLTIIGIYHDPSHVNYEKKGILGHNGGGMEQDRCSHEQRGYGYSCT